MKSVNVLSAAGVVAAGLLLASGAEAAGPPPVVNPTTPVASNFNSSATLYSSRASFNAAAGAVVTDGFEFTPTNTTVPSQGFASGAYTDVNGTTFRLATLPAAGYNGPIDLNLLDSTYLPSTGSYIGTYYGSDVLGSNYSDLVIDFAAPVTSFALDFGSYAIAFGNKSDIFAFSVVGLGTQTAYSISGASSFFGFTSATPFSSVAITTSNNTQRVYDNVSFGAVTSIGAAVPEPASWAMMILGIGAIGGMMRRRIRASEVKFDAKIKRIAAGEIA